MKLLEYEAKKILNQANIAIPKSFIVSGKTPGFLPAVIKSQVPVGGRGKAGGVKVVNTAEEFTSETTRIAALDIKGFTPKTLLAEALIDIDHEYYLSLLIDAEKRQITLMAHREGGMEVEEHAGDDFFTVPVTTENHLAVGEQLAEYLELETKSFILQELVKNLHTCFIQNDATLLEINPLILTRQGDVIAGDCKMTLDDAARFRHPDWRFEDTTAETNFVTLDPHGTVATIANGAGLAMATVDAVADQGLTPANFLDIGGGANEASVLAAFQRIMEYPNVKVIIINIFAGITRCDEVARAIVAARSNIPDLPPLSIRLSGTNFEKAVQILSKEDIPTLATLDECIKIAKETAK